MIQLFFTFQFASCPNKFSNLFHITGHIDIYITINIFTLNDKIIRVNPAKNENSLFFAVFKPLNQTVNE